MPGRRANRPTAAVMRTDVEIPRDVIAELRCEPSLRDDDIAVGVREGVVTLAGFVDSYAEKWTAERVASAVKGVKAIANDIEVQLPSSAPRPDPNIAHAALNALKWTISVPSDRITLKVEKGWRTLEGRSGVALPEGGRGERRSVPHRSQGRDECDSPCGPGPPRRT